ncbi:MAG: hydrogenase iron-sulfur subunit [Planctomycetota bacterium]
MVRAERACPRMADPVERVKSFEAVSETYSEIMARREALRCLNCTGGAECIEEQCAACLTCFRVCPFDVPVVTDVASFPSDLCQACGMCAAECPGEAIRMRRWPPETIANWVGAALKETSDKVVVFECLDRALNEERAAPGTIYLPCTARLSETDVLKALEHGASRVIVRACSGEECRFTGAYPFFARRMQRAQRLLSEIGIKDRFEYEPATGETRPQGVAGTAVKE